MPRSGGRERVVLLAAVRQVYASSNLAGISKDGSDGPEPASSGVTAQPWPRQRPRRLAVVVV